MECGCRRQGSRAAGYSRNRNTPAFIGGDEDRGRIPEFRIALHPIDQRLQEFFIIVGRRIRRMSSQRFEWPNERHRRQRVALNVVQERAVIL